MNAQQCLSQNTALWQSTIKLNNKEIIQHVAGTGGTELDEFNDDNKIVKIINDELKDEGISYEMNSNINNSHGYLKCNITKDNIDIIFVSTSSLVSGGKTKRKTKKRKTRKRKRKTKQKNK